MKQSDPMEKYNYHCSKDGHGLEYPGFSVIFIQTFSINPSLQFAIPKKCVLSDKKYIECFSEREDYYKINKCFYQLADHQKLIKELNQEVQDGVSNGNQDELKENVRFKSYPVYLPRSIENEIFVMPLKQNDFSSKEYVSGAKSKGAIKLLKQSLEEAGKGVSEDEKLYSFPQEGVYRFSMRGFDFEMPLNPDTGETFPSIILKGHANVEMSLFFGRTFSITYRFFFDGKVAEILGKDNKSTNAVTDHIIAFVSAYLSAEFWSNEKTDQEEESEQTDSESVVPKETQTKDKGTIEFETAINLKNFWLDEDGNERIPQDEVISRKGRIFDEVTQRYKRHIYNQYTFYKTNLTLDEKKKYDAYLYNHPITSSDDLHYAMVDIWDDVMHPIDDGAGDLFSRERNPFYSEAEIVNHIRNYHKEELIGLMTLYPSEWPYRDREAYDEVCGRNIAIDTDDLVLTGNSLSMVLGTYGRRGKIQDTECRPAHDGTCIKRQAVDWQARIRERREYNCAWPEYLMILQLLLAKKNVIRYAKDRLVDMTTEAYDKSAEEMIGDNARLGLRISRAILVLDVVKNSKFPSHVIMHDRTAERLKLSQDMEELDSVVNMIDSSLHNLSDYNKLKSEFLMNAVLLLISIVGSFELLFQETDFHFLDNFGMEDTKVLSSWVIMGFTLLSAVAIFFVLKSTVDKLWTLFIKYHVKKRK